MNELYNKIKKTIEDKKISINDLIEKTGLKQSTIYHILKNTENFSNAKLCNVMSILDAVKEEVKDVKINDNLQAVYDSSTGEMTFSLKSVNSQDFEMLINLANEYSSSKQKQNFNKNETAPKQ